MKKNTLAWFVSAAAAIALSGVGMAACSSSSATGNPIGGGGDSGNGGDGSSKDGSTGSDGGGGTDGGGSKDSGGCTGSAPFIPEAGAPNYCFGAHSIGEPDSGNGCTGATPSCCDIRGADGGFSNSCVAQNAAACVGAGADGTGFFECADNTGCPGAQKCCVSKYSDWDGAVFDNSCGKFFGGGGTHCAADCSDSAEVCSSNADCTGGTTCQASKVANKNYGLCLP